MALASGSREQRSGMVRAATHEIVYTPVWHIVRLRVLSSSASC